jgi:hypothetical protein
MKEIFMVTQMALEADTKRERAGPAVTGQMRFVSQPVEERLDTSVPHVTGPVYLSLPFETHDVPIRNGRLDAALSLHTGGFACVRMPTAYASETDANVLRTAYLDEMAPKIQEMLGASRVVPRRNAVYVRASGATTLVDSYNASGLPANFTHIDFAHSDPPRLAKLEDQIQGLESKPYSRMMVIQVWRPVTPPPQDFPLAVCDGRTIGEEDVVEQIAQVGDENIEGNVFRTLKVRFNPAQRWYFFPDMDPDEVIMFKGYDSQPGAAWRVPHSAFDDRARSPHAQPRRSVEARYFVYFD